MNSPIFEFNITPCILKDSSSSWIVSFVLKNTVRCYIRLASYGFSEDDSLYLTMPDHSPVLNCHMICLSGLNTMSHNNIVCINSHLSSLDYPERVRLDIIQEIRAIVQGNVGGGLIYARVSRIETKMYERNQDAEVDNFVETWLQETYRSVPKFIAGDRYVIDSLETVKYSLESKRKENEGCMICLEDYRENSKISRLPCSHVFHGDCIKKWLQINQQCPLCRFQIFL